MNVVNDKAKQIVGKCVLKIKNISRFLIACLFWLYDLGAFCKSSDIRQVNTLLPKTQILRVFEDDSELSLGANLAAGAQVGSQRSVDINYAFYTSDRYRHALCMLQ